MKAVASPIARALYLLGKADITLVLARKWCDFAPVPILTGLAFGKRRTDVVLSRRIGKGQSGIR